jgi:hypothetical protein
MASRDFSATPPSEPDDGLGRMKASSRCQQLHARLVAEDGTAGYRRRRINRQHRQFLALLDQPDAQRLDEGRLAGPRHAGDADADRLAGTRQQRVQHLLRALLVIAAGRLDQRDRLGQRTTLAGQHAVDQGLIGSSKRRRTQISQFQEPPG